MEKVLLVACLALRRVLFLGQILFGLTQGGSLHPA